MLNLLIAQMVSLKRVQQSIQTLIGLVISEATMLKYVLQLHHCLGALGAIGHRTDAGQPALHVDETSLRVDRKNSLDPRLLRPAISP